MTPLLYFTTSVSVLTLFAGAVVLLVWIPVTLLRLARRTCKAVFDPSPPPKKQIEFEGWHPAHHKRAGQ